MPQPKITYQLANNAGYSFQICNIGRSVYNPEHFYDKSQFSDVEVKREYTNLESIHENYLVTVNGYVHHTVYETGRLYIPKATETMLRAKANSVGLLNLTQLGDVGKIKITDDMISLDTILPAFERITLTFPVEVKQPILVLAGYMIFEDPEYFYRVSDTAYVLRLNKINYLEKLYELFRYRDIFKDLNVTVSPTNPTMVNFSEVTSEATIRKLLTTHNSFLVNVDCEPFVLEKKYLERSNVPLNYRTTFLPNTPLFVGYGKLSDYAVNDSALHKYVVTTQDGHYNNHILSAQSFSDLAVLNDHRLPGTTYRISPAFFLHVTT